MAIPTATPRGLLADKVYDSDRFRESLPMHGILPIIPPSRTAGHQSIRIIDRDRNRIERMSGKLRHHRRVAARYDKTILPFESSSTSPRRILAEILCQRSSAGEAR